MEPDSLRTRRSSTRRGGYRPQGGIPMLAELPGTGAPSRTPVDPRPSADQERFRRFGEELDGVKERAVARMGAEDVRYVRRMKAFSRSMDGLGDRKSVV